MNTSKRAVVENVLKYTLSQWIKRMESEFQLEFGALVFQSHLEKNRIRFENTQRRIPEFLPCPKTRL